MKIDNKDQIVILAGGIGKRLGNLTKKKPKSLLPFHKKPFIFYQMDLLKKKGFKNILFPGCAKLSNKRFDVTSRSGITPSLID